MPFTVQHEDRLGLAHWDLWVARSLVACKIYLWRGCLAVPSWEHADGGRARYMAEKMASSVGPITRTPSIFIHYIICLIY